MIFSSFSEHLNHINDYLYKTPDFQKMKTADKNYLDLELANFIYLQKDEYARFDFGISLCRTFASIKTFAESKKMVRTSKLIEYILRLRQGDLSARKLPYEAAELACYPIQNQFTCTECCLDRKERIQMKTLERLLAGKLELTDEPDLLQIRALQQESCFCSPA